MITYRINDDPDEMMLKGEFNVVLLYLSEYIKIICLSRSHERNYLENSVMTEYPSR